MEGEDDMVNVSVTVFVCYLRGTPLTSQKSNQRKQASSYHKLWHLFKAVGLCFFFCCAAAEGGMKQGQKKKKNLPAWAYIECHVPYAASYVDISSHHDSIEGATN